MTEIRKRLRILWIGRGGDSEYISRPLILHHDIEFWDDIASFLQFFTDAEPYDRVVLSLPLSIRLKDYLLEEHDKRIIAWIKLEKRLEKPIRRKKVSCWSFELEFLKAILGRDDASLPLSVRPRISPNQVYLYTPMAKDAEFLRTLKEIGITHVLDTGTDDIVSILKALDDKAAP